MSRHSINFLDLFTASDDKKSALFSAVLFASDKASFSSPRVQEQFITIARIATETPSKPIERAWGIVLLETCLKHNPSLMTANDLDKLRNTAVNDPHPTPSKAALSSLAEIAHRDPTMIDKKFIACAVAMKNRRDDPELAQLGETAYHARMAVLRQKIKQKLLTQRLNP